MHKKWTLTIIIVFFTINLIIFGLMYYYDPYFHFHKPYPNVSYTLGNYVYQNDGITKNFEYNAIITGTSMTEYFSTEEVDSLFNVQSVRLTFLGEGFRRINDNLETAFINNDNIKLVIRGVDPIWFVCASDWLSYGTYDNYPTYLYDNDIWNDFMYVYNFDIIKNDLIPEIKRSISHIPSASFNDFDKDKTGGVELVKEKYIRGPKEIKNVSIEETTQMFSDLSENISNNLLSTISNHPDTTFIIFFPPYGIMYWDELMQMGKAVAERRIDFEQYAIEQLLNYDNVELYTFMDCFDITTDLNNYIDDLHYTPQINSYILQEIYAGNHRLTKENYLEYINNEKSFYLSYDYEKQFDGW